MKAARENKIVTYKKNSINLSRDFQQKLYRPEGSGTIYSKCWKGKPVTKNTLSSEAIIQNKKYKEFFTQTKPKGINGHQISHIRNTKDDSLSEK